MLWEYLTAKAISKKTVSFQSALKQQDVFAKQMPTMRRFQPTYNRPARMTGHLSTMSGTHVLRVLGSQQKVVIPSRANNNPTITGKAIVKPAQDNLVPNFRKRLVANTAKGCTKC